MEFVPLIAMGALVFTLVNFLRYLTNGDFKSAITQLVSWAAGVFVVLLVAQTDFADGISVGDQALSALNFYSLLFVGLQASSIFGFGQKAVEALDNTQTARVPSLVPTSVPDGVPHDEVNP